MNSRNLVPSVLKTVASADLDKQVEHELSVPDPRPQQAKALLERQNESTSGDDRGTSNGTDNQSK